MDIKKEFNLTDFISKITSSSYRGSLSPSTYEIAILGASDILSLSHRLQEFARIQLSAIKNQQLEDGSWSESPSSDFLPDKVICTLAVLLALSKNALLTDLARVKAIKFLNKHIDGPLHDIKKLIGYEVLVSTLTLRLKNAGISIDSVSNAQIVLNPLLVGKVFAKYGRMLYSTRNTFHSTLDILSEERSLKWEDLSQFVEHNGSIGIYPSSTITLISHLNEKGIDSEIVNSGLSYLHSAIDYYGYLPAFFGSEIFEKYWSLFNILHSPLGNQLRGNKKLKKSIEKDINNFSLGLSVSRDFSLPDLDTSAVAASVALEMGLKPDLRFLGRFYKKGVFICYLNEERTSCSANIHALTSIVKAYKLDKKLLDTLNWEEMLTSSLNYLIEYVSKNGSVSDKWYLSDVYGTSKLLCLLVEIFDTSLLGESMRMRVDHTIKAAIKYLHSEMVNILSMKEIPLELLGFIIIALYSATNANLYTFSKINISKIKMIFSKSEQSNYCFWLGKSLYRSEDIYTSLNLSTRACLDC